MGNADRRDANRILSTALEDPDTVPERALDRAFELLDSDAKRVRVGAAWAFGIVAAETPGRVLPFVPRIAAHLEADSDGEHARALAYIARADSDAIEHRLRGMDEPAARRCREARWGQFAPRTVVETPDDGNGDGADDGAAMGRGDSDAWGWVGGGTTAAYTAGSEPDRRRPPTERPVEPPPIDADLDRFTPAETIHRGDVVDSYKVVYHTPERGSTPGLLKRFRAPGAERFRSAFDRRMRMWHSIDDEASVLPVISWGTDPEPWVVTAYEDVTGVADIGRSGDLAAAVWTLRTVADSLRFAHARGVVHGGLTPGSVVRSSILSEPDAWRYPRLTDWGYLSLLRENALSSSVPDRYLAPEHAAPESFGPVDGVTDVYGFGTVAFEALTGRAPSPPDRDRPRSPDAEFPFPPELDRRAPDLESVLARCLAGRKPERFETIEAMTAAFDAATEGIDGR